MENLFFENVYKIVAQVPRGKVVSYGQIALMLGDPRAARQVGWAMRHCPDGLPWQRVVRADGSVAGGAFSDIRAAMLGAEGVAFLPDGRVDLSLCQWTAERDKPRCRWCLSNAAMTRYHDEEWGVPLRDDKKQFEFLMMEAMQCGLNWNMMIRKREIFRQCFDDFDFDAVAAYSEADIQRILETEGMIRSRRKIEAVIHNARCFQCVREQFGSFSDYLWGFSDGKIFRYDGHQAGGLPARNGFSDRVAADLRRRGFRYLGSVTVYSHLQACGIINDHEAACFRYGEILGRYPAVCLAADNEA
jgi:DNA-3-methyladenine glycosylase I